MQFMRMQVTGFKSFVEPTEVEFLSGLTGVVGPNGCGKSNLVEALRWAMGEISAKQVRGGEMDDVIFFGTDNRPARNLAEVILTLDNTDRRAPTPFNHSDELSVARHIERGRGSCYRINGADVRQRDVMTLFADASTGARSTALVSQGRIGSIINAKPADRRTLLEEAAGINGLYSRRQEAETRLRAAQTNLDRLDDVIAALESQYQALKRQARQAARYRNLTENIRRQEAIVLHLLWSEACRQHDEAEAARLKIDHEVNELVRQVAVATTEATQIEADLPALREKHRNADTACQNLSTAIRILEGEEQRIEARCREIELQIRQINDDYKRQNESCENAGQQAQLLENEKVTLTGALAHDEQNLRDTASALEKSRADVLAGQGRLEDLAQAVSATETRASALKQQILECQTRRTKLQERHSELEESLKSSRVTAGHDAALAQARDEAERAEHTRNSIRRRLADAEERTTTARRAEEQQRQAYERDAASATRLRSEVSALSELLATDGSDHWPPVVDFVEVDTGYEVALGAALGDDLEAPLDAESPVHWHAGPDRCPLSRLPSSVRPLSAHVRGPAALQSRLSQIGLIEDESEGPMLRDRLSQGQRLVSRSGALWRWDGFTVAAGTPTPAARRLEQRNRLEILRGSILAAEAKETDARIQREKCETDVRIAQDDENALRAEAREAGRLLEIARDKVSKLMEQVTVAQSRIAGLIELETQLVADMAEVDDKEAAATKALSTLNSLAEQRAAFEQQRSLLDDSRRQLDEASNRHTRLEQESNARRQRLNAIPREQISWERQLKSANEQLDSLGARRQQAVCDLEDNRARPEQIRNERSGLIERQNEAGQNRSDTADALARAESQLEDATRTLRKREHELSDGRVERERRQADVTLHAQEISRITEAARERLQTTPETLLAAVGIDSEDRLPSLEEGEQRLERLRGERHRLGEVNLRVEEEVAALDEKIRSMSGERDDLLAAIAKLRQGISGLNREGRKRLLDAFEQADRHFRDLFQGLFDGGEAKLQLTDSEDPLDAGLEVLASPPGKRMQNLTLMSGGEQALTALALLFTVFLINPAPICVLDEVDAPLDNDNVDRFCRLLEELERRLSTKFLIITHNSQTMAHMNYLYGVTMPEPGVSQLVSVDLQTAGRLADAA